jgi:hypothetical protein
MKIKLSPCFPTSSHPSGSMKGPSCLRSQLKWNFRRFCTPTLFPLVTFREVTKRRRLPSIGFDKSPIEIRKPKETHHISHTSWLRPILNCSHAIRLHCNTFWTNRKSQVGNRIGMECAFTKISVQLIVAKSLQHRTDVSNVLLFGIGENYNII